MSNIPDEAINALVAAGEADAAKSQPAEQAQAQPEQVEQQEQPTQDSFTSLDPTSLPEEARPFYQSMLADYTRKTQEAAPWRKLGEELGVEPEAARQAVEFYNRLNSDPDTALEVYEHLSNSLSEAGYLDDDPSFSEYGNVPSAEGHEAPGESYLPPELDERLSRIEQIAEEVESERYYDSLAARVMQQEAQIVAANPSYKEEDLKGIYQLSFSTDGDLHAAQKVYEELKQNIASNLLASKAAVPAGAGTLPSGGHAVPSQRFTTLDEAHSAAEEALRNVLNEG